MKPVITFALGALLATVIALFVVKRDPAPVPPAPVASVPTPVAEPEPVVTEPAPLPSPPVASTPAPARPVARRETRTASRPERNSSPTFSSTASSRPTSVSSTPQQTTPAASENSSTTTTVSGQGGPPQTTLHLPPPPDGGRPSVDPTPAAPARVPQTVTIPVGTLLAIRVDERLSSDVSHTGDSFRATLEQPLVVDGAVIAERGARVEGRISESDPGGRVRGTATLALELVRLNTADGQRVRLQTEGFTKNAQRSTKKDAAKVGIGAGIGAAIGAIAGGGKGAAIGAGVGGAAGTGAVMTSRGDPVEVPAETRLSFRLSEAITVTEKFK